MNVSGNFLGSNEWQSCKTISVLETIQLLIKNVFSLLGQILYKLAFFHIEHKKEERKEHLYDVTENMWCHLTATVGR